jgi:hypothetical protein
MLRLRVQEAREALGLSQCHADTQMVVKVYGRYKPTETERREWERIAALQDEERAKAARGA